MILRADSSSCLSWLTYISPGLLPMAMVCDLASTTDFVLLFTLTLFRNWKSAFRILQSYNLQPFFRIATGAAVAFAIAQIAKWLRKQPGTNIKSTNESPKPLFFPSRTTHTRLFPKTNSFSCSYMLVGIPVGWQGSVGGMLSADRGTHYAKTGFQDGSSSSSWYPIDAGDYLDRGHCHLGLEGKLRRFMQSQVCFYQFSWVQNLMHIRGFVMKTIHMHIS
jgi:hypothetical protein